MIVAVLIFSFVVDSIFSNLIPLNSFFVPLFSLMALIIVYPYYNEKISKFLRTCFILGVFYDLIYTDTIIVHGFLFLLIGFLIIMLNRLLANNYVNVIIMAIVCIVCYRVVFYILLLMTGTSFDFWVFLKSIYHSLFANIIFVVLLYITIDKISIKFKIRKSI